MFSGAPKDTLSSQTPRGSLSACPISPNDLTSPSVDCNIRPPNLDSNPFPGDTFDDQMMGVSVLAVDNGGRAGSEVCYLIIESFRSIFKCVIFRYGLVPLGSNDPKKSSGKMGWFNTRSCWGIATITMSKIHLRTAR